MTKIRLFNPAIIFLTIWIVQIFGYLIFYKETGINYSAQTWQVILSGVVLFLAGSLIGRMSFSKLGGLTTQLKKFSSYTTRDLFPAYFEKLALLVYFILISISLFFVVKFLNGKSNEIHSIADMRNVINLDFLNDRIIYNYLRVFQMGVAVSVFFLALDDLRSPKKAILFFAIAFFSAVLTTSRLFLLLVFVCGVVIAYYKKLIKIKGIVFAILTFSLIFFAWAFVYGKGTSAGQGFLLWNIKNYFFAGLKNFDYFVVSGQPRFNSPIMIPNAIKVILNHIGFHLQMRPNYNPVIAQNQYNNIFTFFYPLYHDGGLLFVAIGCFFMGLVHQLIYLINEAVKSPTTIYIFAISLYPLLLTFFEDAYFSSPGFWFILLLPVFVYVGRVYFKQKKLTLEE